LRSYLYEYMFFRTIERTQQNLSETILISEARRLRDLVGEKLTNQGLSMTDSGLKVTPVLRAIEETMRAEVPGYRDLFSQAKDDGVPFSVDSLGYAQLSREFMRTAGLSTEPSGAAGPRLPISPYDPRWAVRSTVKQAGSNLLNVPDHLIEEVVAGEVGDLESSDSEALYLYGSDQDDKNVEFGRAMSADDMSGMAELMGLMSTREYNDVRQWMIDGGLDGNGQIDHRRYMGPDALARSVAILRELGEQGTPYTVTRDLNPGQIRANIEGTKIGVRLSDTRDNDDFVGRVYDNGVVTRYTTNRKVAGTDRVMGYTPTTAESVDLLRMAQGLPVQRSDGKGIIGAVNTRSELVWDKAVGDNIYTEIQDSYHSAGSAMFVVGNPPTEDFNEGQTSQVFVRRDGTQRSVSSKFFVDQDSAAAYLTYGVETARENFMDALRVEALIAAAQEHAVEAAEGEWFPEFDGDPEVAAIQRSYWDVLRGAQDNLLRPGATEDAYRDKVDIIGELSVDNELGESVHEYIVGDIAYVGSPEDQIRAHSADALDYVIGQYEQHEVPDAEGHWQSQRFDPVRLAKFMDSEYGTWRNNDDIVAALRASGIPAEELMGDSFYTNTIKDRLIKFDAASAQSIGEIEDPFVQGMAETVRDAIERNGAAVNDVAVDANGIVSWSAERQSGFKGKTETVTGQIGQIFTRGEYGEIVTKFAGGDNYLFVPGYEAGIAVQKVGENKTVEERSKLRGYDQILRDQIQYQVSSEILSQRTDLGEPTSLNSVYRRLYDVRHDVDFIERSAEEGLTPEWRDAILSTEGRRVRYPNAVRDGSTINAEYQADKGRGLSASDPANDNTLDPWILTGQRNMAIMGEESDGYFDPMVTSGSINQGVTRYLVEGAVVSADGTIVPGDKDDRTPLMKHPDTASMRYNPFDRQQMTASNLMRAAAVTEPVATAMMTFGGWTADDPMVVSRDFAQKHQIRGAEGTMRDLVVGDKLSDLHGNKGVISLVVDREMDLADARELGLEKEVAWFKKNNIDVIMSPFSAVSRFNGGTARELMESDAQPLHHPFVDANGETREPLHGAQGEMRFVVTHMAVDSKTKVYDDAALAEGRGRKASSQLAWALGSQNCEKVMAECYGPNSTAVSNFRETLIAMGLDMEADGTLRVGFDDMDEASERRLFPMPELIRTEQRKSINGRPPARPGLNLRLMKREFGAQIGNKGGDLELPFSLKMPSGLPTPQATDASWKLPVLSSHLRSGQDLDDGSSTVHDYTNHYLAIHEQSLKFRFAQEELKDEALSAEQHKRHTQTLTEAPRLAQSAYDRITESLKSRRFSGKSNIFKEGLMASRLPHSATAVWTSDPRLDIDQVAMGPAMAEALGFKENDHALIWRDPVLRDGGVRYMRVAIDSRLTGVAINPVMDACFDGDFDGDAVAVVRLTSDAAKLEAMQKLSVESNLLDLGSTLEDGSYSLSMQDSLDTKVSQHVDPELTERFEALRMRANDAKFDLDEGEIDQAAAWDANSEILGELSDYYRDALSGQFGDAALSFDDVPSHLRSVMSACVETGAKGSAKKVRDYARYLGADPDTFADLGESQATQDDHEGVMYATAIKSFGTGVAGMFSQRGVKALRNEELKAVLELTYPVTQSILQSKHDPAEARQKYEMLMGPARAHWKGRKLDATVGDNGARVWKVATDGKGKEIQADTETWKRQFQELYTAADGLNVRVNDENIDKVAAALSKDGMVIDIEDKTSHAVDAPKLGSTMDRLAYGGTFDDVLAAAAERENVFSGVQNSGFAPHVIKKNQQAIAEYDEQVTAGFDAELPELSPLVKRDVLADHNELSRVSGGAEAPSPFVTAIAARPRTRVIPAHSPSVVDEKSEVDALSL